MIAMAAITLLRSTGLPIINIEKIFKTKLVENSGPIFKGFYLKLCDEINCMDEWTQWAMFERLKTLPCLFRKFIAGQTLHQQRDLFGVCKIFFFYYKSFVD